MHGQPSLRVAQKRPDGAAASDHIAKAWRTGDDAWAHQAARGRAARDQELSGFRGESRFTTWAYKFVILEVSTKLGRHFWQKPTVALDAEDWDRLPDRFGMDPADHAQGTMLVDAVHRAVDEHLTERQRQAFVALVVQGVPLDALVMQLGVEPQRDLQDLVRRAT